MIATFRPRIHRLRPRPQAVAPRLLLTRPAGHGVVLADRQLTYFRHLWGTLHRRALQHPGRDEAWLAEFGLRLPCGPCRAHWAQLLRELPPTWDTYFRWTIQAHNRVNEHLGKPAVLLETALARWGGTSS